MEAWKHAKSYSLKEIVRMSNLAFLDSILLALGRVLSSHRMKI